jgi:hypothetical protein
MSIWQMDRVVGMCGSLEEPKRANVWLLDAALAPKRPNVSLRRA